MTREEAITYLNVIWNRYKAEYEIERETLDAYHMAIESLSADVAEWQGEIVRCKDCIHRIDRRSDLGHFMCEMFYGQGDVSDENFCQWGKRKEE